MKLGRVVVALCLALGGAAYAQSGKGSDLELDLSGPPAAKAKATKPPAKPATKPAAAAKDPLALPEAKAAGSKAKAGAATPDPKLGAPGAKDPLALPDPKSGAAGPAVAQPGPKSFDLPLPDLLKADAKPTYQLGIYRLVHPGQPNEPLFDDIERIFVSVSEVAPAIRSTVLMKSPPKACDLEDDGCFALLGGFQELHQILVGSLTKAENGLAVRVRIIDVQSQRRISQAEQLVASTDPTEIKAWAEALACKLLLRDGCAGEALIDADLPEMQLVVDQSPLKRTGEGSAPEKIRLPVGVHRMRVTIGQSTSLERALPILRISPPGVALYARQFAQGGLSLLAPQDLPLDKDGNRKPAPSVRPKVVQAGTKWTKTAGFVIAGVGVAAAGVGGWQGLRSKSLVSDANAGFDKNGGYYSAADVTTIESARTAATTANALFITGAVLAVAGATLILAF